jgi:hypothetical protein
MAKVKEYYLGLLEELELDINTDAIYDDEEDEDDDDIMICENF